MREYVRITNSKGETLEFDTDTRFDIEIIRENKGARLRKAFHGSYVKQFENGYNCDSTIQLCSNCIEEDLGVIEDDSK